MQERSLHNDSYTGTTETGLQQEADGEPQGFQHHSQPLERISFKIKLQECLNYLLVLIEVHVSTKDT